MGSPWGGCILFSVVCFCSQQVEKGSFCTGTSPHSGVHQGRLSKCGSSLGRGAVGPGDWYPAHCRSCRLGPHWGVAVRRCAPPPPPRCWRVSAAGLSLAGTACPTSRTPGELVGARGGPVLWAASRKHVCVTRGHGKVAWRPRLRPVLSKGHGVVNAASGVGLAPLGRLTPVAREL